MPLENVMMDVMLIVSPAHTHTNTIPGIHAGNQNSKIAPWGLSTASMPLCMSVCVCVSSCLLIIQLVCILCMSYFKSSVCQYKCGKTSNGT